jgi:hypothetical protein
MNQVMEYNLPVTNNKDMSVTHSVINNKFCRYNLGTYTFKPKMTEDVGTWVVSGIISNPWDEINFSFNVKVINDPPIFSREIEKNIKAPRDVY